MIHVMLPGGVKSYERYPTNDTTIPEGTYVYISGKVRRFRWRKAIWLKGEFDKHETLHYAVANPLNIPEEIRALALLIPDDQ